MKTLFSCLLFSGLMFAADIHKTSHQSIRSQQANPGSWRSVGPVPPAIPAAIAVHAPSHTIYIGSLGGGILKSTDGGATFVAVDQEVGCCRWRWIPTIQMSSTRTGSRRPMAEPPGSNKGVAWDSAWPWIRPTRISFTQPTSESRKQPTVVKPGGCFNEGLGDAQIFSLAINPFHPKVLFAGSVGDGAFKSVNGGRSWTPIDIDSSVWGLLVDPDDGDIVYAGSNGNGVYKSTDGGDTFARVGSPEVGVVFSIVKSGQKLYAGTAGGGVSVSEDGGVTWTNTGVTQSQGLMLSVDSEGAVYVGTNVDGAFVLSTGGHWRRLAWGQLKKCACQQGHGIAVDPSNHDHVFFTTNDGGLLVTEDAGQSWHDGGVNGFVSRSSRAVAFDPQQPRRVYASSVAGGLFKSEDHGKHWHRRRFGSSSNLHNRHLRRPG